VLAGFGGQVLEESRVATTAPALERRFRGIEGCRVVVEVGGHSPWVSRLLQQLGHEVIVANARQVRLIAESTQKDDVLDAALLARLGRVDPQLLRPLQHRPEAVQADLALLRARDVLVGARRNLINSARGMVKAAGGRLPGCSSASFARKAAPHIPAALRAALQGMLETLGLLTQQIDAYDEQIEALGRRYPDMLRLRQVVGVGPITAAAFVLTLADPERFRQSRSVGPYLGLCRRRRQSGESDPELGHQQGRQPVPATRPPPGGPLHPGPLGPDCDLRRFGQRIAGSGRSGKKRAAVAVARKLAVLLHRLWVSGAQYDPDYQGRRAPAGSVTA
jgi:transposase